MWLFNWGVLKKAPTTSKNNQQLILDRVLAIWWPKVFSFCVYFLYVLLRLLNVTGNAIKLLLNH